MSDVMGEVESDGPTSGDGSMNSFGAVLVTPTLDQTFYMKLRPLSDNNGYDWQFICWYFHHFPGENSFGHSSTNLGAFYKGLVCDTSKNFQHLRITKHTHHPVDDARGNAEAMLAMIKEYGLKIKL